MRAILIAAYLIAALAAPAFAQRGTQPPAGNNPDRICVGPGAAGLRLVPAGTGSIYPHDGVGTEDAPVQANAKGECAEATPVPQSTPVPTLTATPVPTVPVEGVQATPAAIATPAETPATPVPTEAATATPEASATQPPTSTPTPRPTPTPLVEPTPTLAPGEPEHPDIQPCYEGGPLVCGEKT